MEILKTYRTCIAISVSFFIFGFFTAAHFFELSANDIAVGLIGGAIGGITILVVSIEGSIGIRPEIRRRLGWDA